MRANLRGHRFFKLALFRLWLAGLVIAGVALGGAVAVRDCKSSGDHCQRQKEFQQKNLQTVDAELKRATMRKELLERALTQPQSQAFPNARQELKRERKIIKAVEARKRGLKTPKAGTELYWIIPAWFLPFVLTAGISLFMLKDFPWVAKREESERPLWLRPYVAATILLSLSSTGEGILTSVLPVETKGWFSWDSYCIAPWSFFFARVALVGCWMSFALPVAIFYASGHRLMVPQVQIMNADGMCGVGGYVSRLQKWTFVGSVAVLIPTIFWVRIVVSKQGSLSPGYLLTPAIITLVTLLLVFRQVRNAVLIRQRYYEARTNLGKNWPEIAALEVPPDPTAGFISAEWWKLPTVVYPVVAAVWFIAELLGVGQRILEQIR